MLKKKKKVGTFSRTSHFSVVFSVLYFTFTLKLGECNTGDLSRSLGKKKTTKNKSYYFQNCH